ncbi:MAG TPA: DUF6427 family protein [Bacteroidales bacterium]|nr:DUF6427 family protein [Bacteroidales bacterium]
MLLRLFKGTGPGVILLIIITLAVVWIGTFLSVPAGVVPADPANQMPLYGLLLRVIGDNPYPGVIFSFSMAAVMSLIITHFNTTIFFINERTYLPALIYILFGGILPQYQLLNPVLPASFFLMMALMKVMSCYRKQGLAYSFFDAGLLIGTGSLFYADLIWYGLLLLIGIAILRTFNIGEIIISLLGLITPYIITFGLYYVMGKDIIALLSLVISNLFDKPETYVFSRMAIVSLAFACIIMIVSLIYLSMLMSTKKIQSRKTFFLLMWVFLISLGIYFALPSATAGIIWLISIPASYFMTHYFVFVKKKLVPEIFFSVFFILVLLIQIKMWFPH